MQIKVCGLKYAPNIAEVVKLSIDFAGFIFYEKSTRYALPEFEECGIISCKPKKTGVFVNESNENILQIVKKYKLDAVQLHGSESASQLEHLKDQNLVIIKAFQLQESSDFGQMNDFIGLADYFLFDSQSKGFGGSGKKFNWDLLLNYKLEIPFFLSGGLCEHDADELIRFKHSQLVGFDINSCFEIQPGLKNIQLLKKFIEKIKNHDTK